MLDFEYAKALAEVVLDTTCSEKEREVRLECSTQIFGRANAYLKKGFLPDVVEAFFVRKMKGLPLVSTKQDMQDFLKVSTPHYFGGKFTVSNIPYYSEEEELLLWSETSLRGPLITAGYERYDIRFDLESFYGGLHCGECFDVKVKNVWVPVRIEMGDDWYLVGLNVSRLDGLRVRM